MLINYFEKNGGAVAQISDLDEKQYKMMKDIYSDYIIQSYISNFMYVVELDALKFFDLFHDFQNFKIYYRTVRQMINDQESGLYIKIYINDLMRGGDITALQAQVLHNLVIDAIGGNGFETIAAR